MKNKKTLNEMSTGQYQRPYRDGFREWKGNLQIRRYKQGEFEIWESVPHTLPDGRVMRKVGEQIVLDDGAYVVVDVTPSGALCESRTKKVVEYTTDGGQKVKFTATRKGTIRVNTYRESKPERRGSSSKRVL
tara:strand:- start:223 stop:618 length:396 start_codon:yes stop_codon:yes gene_type:complete